MSLELSVLASHVPRICHEEKAPDVQLPLVEWMPKAAAFYSGY